jgi:AraC-like DNA-binding protein
MKTLRAPYLSFRYASSSPLGRITEVGLARVDGGGAPSTMRIFGSYALVYSLDGQAHYQDGNGLERDIVPADLIVVFPELAHRYGPRPGQRWTEFFLVFEGPVFDLWRECGLLDVERPILHVEPVDQWLTKLEAVPGAPRQPGSEQPMVEVCRLMQVMAEALAWGGGQGTPAEQRIMARARAALESDHARELDLEQLSRELGMSYETFRKRFARHCGMPPARYRVARLVDRACALMETSSLTDKQIADRLGFGNQFYFSRRFKQIVGVSPREFRRRVAHRMGS